MQLGLYLHLVCQSKKVKLRSEIYDFEYEIIKGQRDALRLVSEEPINHKFGI